MPFRYPQDQLAGYKVLCARVGDRIRQARLDANLAQEGMAIKLNRSRSWVSAIESGRQGPNILDLLKIASLTGRPLDYFVSRRPRSLAAGGVGNASAV